MHTFKVRIQNCPYCGARNDHATQFEDEKPLPGDVAVCVECAGVCVFGPRLQLQKLSAELRRQLICDGQWGRVLTAQEVAAKLLAERRAEKN